MAQNENEKNASKFGAQTNQTNNQVDSAQINCDPCVVHPTCKNFNVDDSEEMKKLKDDKFDFNPLMGSVQSLITIFRADEKMNGTTLNEVVTSC